MTWAIPLAWGGPTGGRPIPIPQRPVPISPVPGLGTPVNPRDFNPVWVEPPPPQFGDPRGFTRVCPPPMPWVKVKEDMDAGITEKEVDIQDALCPEIRFDISETYTIFIRPAPGTTYAWDRDLGENVPVNKIVDIHAKLKRITYTLKGIPRSKINLQNLNRNDSVDFRELNPDLFTINGVLASHFFRLDGAAVDGGPRVTTNFCVPLVLTPAANNNFQHVNSWERGDYRCVQFALTRGTVYYVSVYGPNAGNGLAPIQVTFNFRNRWTTYLIHQGPVPGRSRGGALVLARPIEFRGFDNDDTLTFNDPLYSYFRFSNSWNVEAQCDGRLHPAKIVGAGSLPPQIDPQGRCLVVYKEGAGNLTATFAHDPATDRSRPDLLLTLNGVTLRVAGQRARLIQMRTLANTDTITLASPAAPELLKIEGNPRIIAATGAGRDCGSSASTIDGLGTIAQCQSADCRTDTAQRQLASGYDPTVATAWDYTCLAEINHQMVYKCEISTDGDTLYAVYRPRDDENGCLGADYAEHARGKLLTVRTLATFRGTDANGCPNNTECDVTMVVDASGVAEDFVGIAADVDPGRFVGGDPNVPRTRVDYNLFEAILSFETGLRFTHDERFAGETPYVEVSLPPWLEGLVTSLFWYHDTSDMEPSHYEGDGRGDWNFNNYTLSYLYDCVSDAGYFGRNGCRSEYFQPALLYLGFIFDTGSGMTIGTPANDFIISRPGEAVVKGLKGNDVIISLGGMKAIMGDDDTTIVEEGHLPAYADADDIPSLVKKHAEEGGNDLVYSMSDSGNFALLHGGTGYWNRFFDTNGDVLMSVHSVGNLTAHDFLVPGQGDWHHAYPMEEADRRYRCSQDEILDWVEGRVGGSFTCYQSDTQVNDNMPNNSGRLAVTDRSFYPLGASVQEGKAQFRDEFYGPFEDCLERKTKGICPANTHCNLSMSGLQTDCEGAH